MGCVVMTIEKTLEFDNHKVEIDDWGGVHIHYPDGHEAPLSYSPETINRIEKARKEVMSDE